MTLRRELFIVLGIVIIGWVLLMSLVSKWQRTSAAGKVTIEPQLVHYPGTESAPEQEAPNLGFRKYWFHLGEDYPSLSVYTFYQRKLEPDGWKLLREGAPQWIRRYEKKEALDLFRATWISADGLFQLDLEMMSTVKLIAHEDGEPTEKRQRGIDVFVTLRRVLLPGIAAPVPGAPLEKAVPAGPQIEVK